MVNDCAYLDSGAGDTGCEIHIAAKTASGPQTYTEAGEFVAKRSAGLLMYRFPGENLEVFLVHPGGPFWTNKDEGAWSIPKGEYAEGEQPLEAAKREFKEETGFVPGMKFLELGVVKQAGGKQVSAWAFEGDCDPQKLISDHCRMEWPPRSGRSIEFPEIDRGAWLSIAAAHRRILKSQEPFLDMLLHRLGLS